MQIAYRKDLSNLALQETRLRRHRQVDTEKLASLQTARREAEKRRKDMSFAIRLYDNARNVATPSYRNYLASNFRLPKSSVTSTSKTSKAT